ncbi:MAG: glutamate racemase [Gammaproteobacteria bacterium]
MPTVNANSPIGVFDSGVGGLSVLHEIRRQFPGEDLLYVADSRYAPYGDRPSPFIASRAAAIVDFFVNMRVKAIVVACNTVTGVAIEKLRARYPLPMIAMEPAIKPAAQHTRSGVIGVLATTRTLSSANVSRLVDLHGRDLQVLLQPCPGFVEQVESGELFGSVPAALVARYVIPLVEKNADTLVLGCTHYPFLSPLIREIAGPDVTVIEPAAAIARELGRRLARGRLLSGTVRRGSERFWSSGPAGEAQAVMAKLWGKNIAVERLPSTYCHL